jgi:hypothetical protein
MAQERPRGIIYSGPSTNCELILPVHFARTQVVARASRERPTRNVISRAFTGDNNSFVRTRHVIETASLLIERIKGSSIPELSIRVLRLNG